MNCEYPLPTTELVRQIRALRSENEFLRHRIKLFEETTSIPPIAFPRSWNLTMQQSRVLSMLLNAEEYIPRTYIMAKLPPVWSSDRHVSAAAVYVCGIRKKVTMFGDFIENVRGLGYFIPRGKKSEILLFCGVKNTTFDDVEAAQ